MPAAGEPEPNQHPPMQPSSPRLAFVMLLLVRALTVAFLPPTTPSAQAQGQTPVVTVLAEPTPATRSAAVVPAQPATVFLMGPLELRPTSPVTRTVKAPAPSGSTPTASGPAAAANDAPTIPIPVPEAGDPNGSETDISPGEGGGMPPSGASLSMGDPFFDTLPPVQQREAMAFADSLPRFLADPAKDGFLHQADEVLFPEPVDLRIGRASVGGGLLTAIARRNPFALLNILDVFHLSW